MLAEAGIEVLNISMTVTPLTSPVEKNPPPLPFFFLQKLAGVCMHVCFLVWLQKQALLH
jgi:uncharacterized membrane protein